MAASRLLLLLLLLQLGAVAAASSLLLAASCVPVVDAAPPPTTMMSRDAASATNDVPRTVDDCGVAVARRLGTLHGLRLRRRLSDDIPAAAPAAADDYGDISADAPDSVGDDYDDIPAGAPEWWPDAAGDYDVAPAAAASPSGDDGDVGAEDADEFTSTVLDFALIAVVFVLSVIGGSGVVSLLVVGLVKCSASLPSHVVGLYAAAKTAREKATRVRPLDDDQDAVEPAGH